MFRNRNCFSTINHRLQYFKKIELFVLCSSYFWLCYWFEVWYCLNILIMADDQDETTTSPDVRAKKPCTEVLDITKIRQSF